MTTIIPKVFKFYVFLLEFLFSKCCKAISVSLKLKTETTQYNQSLRVVFGSKYRLSFYRSRIVLTFR